MKPYPYQEQVKQIIQSGKSVILQAPTGAGKTYAALLPFIDGFFSLSPHEFPQQCLYSVPMRVLANQFIREYEQRIKAYKHDSSQNLRITLQTGEFSEDPELTGDLIFTTIDQTLSSFLGVPYSLSQGRSNLNVGAILGSYLVFDEFHLFPQEATGTLLHLLKSIAPLTPFLLMTATFSTTMLEQLSKWLGAQIVRLNQEEVTLIETQSGQLPRKSRSYHILEELLTPKSIIEKGGHRTLVVCNTVERANQLYDALLEEYRGVPFDIIPKSLYQKLNLAQNLKDRRKILKEAIKILYDNINMKPDVRWVMLLHSRFERAHRLVKEEFLQSIWNTHAIQSIQPHLTVVATQVVEVGLDISAETLHTEIAPSASIFQRAGRCARYPGEQGRVYIYQVPANKNGEPDYSPYLSLPQKEIVKHSWEAFHKREGKTLYFEDEQFIIDETHTPYDKKLFQQVKKNSSAIWEGITRTMAWGEVSFRKELIRNNLSSRTIVVCEVPSRNHLSEKSPYQYEGFSLHIGTLKGAFKGLTQLGNELGLDWILRYPVPVEEEESRTPIIYRWLDVENEDDFSQSLIFAIHPQLVSYDVETGFRLGFPGNGTYQSPQTLPSEAIVYKGYRLESYQHHIEKMINVYEQGPWRKRIVWLDHRLDNYEDKEGRLSRGMLDRSIRLAMALHDAGKLDLRWQNWAICYQKIITGKRPDFLIAHTDWNPDNPLHQEAQKKASRKCPKPKTHAGEGAEAGAKILWEALGKIHQGLYKASYSAIARHHSPYLRTAEMYKLSPNVQEHLADVFTHIGGAEWREWALHLRQERNQSGNLSERRLLSPYPEDSLLNWWLYFIIVRNLRLCDQFSQKMED